MDKGVDINNAISYMDNRSVTGNNVISYMDKRKNSRPSLNLVFKKIKKRYIKWLFFKKFQTVFHFIKWKKNNKNFKKDIDK